LLLNKIMNRYTKDLQYVKFCAYGFLKNLRFFDAFFILFLVDKGLSYTQIGVLYGVREIVRHSENSYSFNRLPLRFLRYAKSKMCNLLFYLLRRWRALYNNKIFLTACFLCNNLCFQLIYLDMPF